MGNYLPMTREKMESLLAAYSRSSATKLLHEKQEDPSFLEIMHADQEERGVFYFLKWLFEDKDTSKPANEWLLSLLKKRNRLQPSSYFPKELSNEVIQLSFRIVHAMTKLDEKERRLIIELVCSSCKKDRRILKIILVDDNSDECLLKETDNDYHNEEISLFVQLCNMTTFALDAIEETTGKMKNYIRINYQDLLDDVLTKTAKEEAIPIRKQIIIQEYMNTLNKNNMFVMQPEVRELLIDFWNNNHQLFEWAAQALTEDPNQDEEENEAIVKIVESLKELSARRDGICYSINGQGKYRKASFIWEIIKAYIVKKDFGNTSIEELQRVFPYTWRGETETLDNLIVISEERFLEEVKRNPSEARKWKRTNLMLTNGEVICVNNSAWDKVRMKDLIENEIKKIPELSDLVIEEIK